MNRKINHFSTEGAGIISFSGGRTGGYILKQVPGAFGAHLPDGIIATFANTAGGGGNSLVRATMPLDNPGGLKEQEYVDLMAYLLQANHHQGGDLRGLASTVGGPNCPAVHRLLTNVVGIGSASFPSHNCLASLAVCPGCGP